MSLIGRRVVVTGASSGLGAHTARQFAARGARVLAVARRAERLEALAAATDGEGSITPFVADVTDPAQCEALARAVDERLSGIDVLVNNAGSEVQGAIDALALEDFEGMLRANVTSIFLVTRAVLPGLRASRGSVVNLGSTAVTRPPRNRFGYVASKGAVEAMTRALAVDLGRYGIRVNAVRPGIVPSELRGLSEAEERARFDAGGVTWRQALDVIGAGEDVAAAVCWLASDESRFVTGAALDVDGGFTLGIADADRR
jgi:meso-butanediol dehydrogenase/(S,S)-butanediol dehydrogenase/diacetyl reductase